MYLEYCCYNKNLIEDVEKEKSPILLIIATISAVGAIGLGAMIAFGKKDE